MTTLAVDGLTFTFPTDWQVCKYDEWQYYRKSFSRMIDGLKAVDIMAIDPVGRGWLIEVKDYRRHERSKPSMPWDEIALKVIHTLAAVVPASIGAGHDDERRLATMFARAIELRVVLHIEQPTLKQPIYDPADLQQKLQQRVRAIDPHPKVVDMASQDHVPWRFSG